jgi:hypothetical protein
MRRDDSSFESAQATSRDRGGLHDSANLADAASRGSPGGSPFAPSALVEGGTATRALAETIIRGLLGKRSEKMASKAAARRSCGVPAKEVPTLLSRRKQCLRPLDPVAIAPR